MPHFSHKFSCQAAQKLLNAHNVWATKLRFFSSPPPRFKELRYAYVSAYNTMKLWTEVFWLMNVWYKTNWQCNIVVYGEIYFQMSCTTCNAPSSYMTFLFMSCNPFYFHFKHFVPDDVTNSPKWHPPFRECILWCHHFTIIVNIKLTTSSFISLSSSAWDNVVHRVHMDELDGINSMDISWCSLSIAGISWPA